MLQLLIVLALLGVAYYCVNRFGGAWGVLATIAKVVIIIAAIYEVLVAFGLWTTLTRIALPHA